MASRGGSGRNPKDKDSETLQELKSAVTELKSSVKDVKASIKDIRKDVSNLKYDVKKSIDKLVNFIADDDRAVSSRVATIGTQVSYLRENVCSNLKANVRKLYMYFPKLLKQFSLIFALYFRNSPSPSPSRRRRLLSASTSS